LLMAERREVRHCQNSGFMSSTQLVRAYLVTFAIVSLPFVFIHIMANPDDAPISPLQHAAAALANFFGPWGVAMVRLVDFPNAGLRSFSVSGKRATSNRGTGGAGNVGG
jgi:hypothetical protein